MMHRFTLRVRYADVDAMGWVYYGRYLTFFEIGRAEMLRSLGRSYAQVERDDGVLLPVIEARAFYLRGARYDEAVVVETGILARGRATLRFGYRLLGEDEATLALGYTEHCLVDRTGRPMRPPAALMTLLDRAPQVEGPLALQMNGEVSPRGR